MNWRQAKKIYDARRGRKDSPGIAFSCGKRGPYPRNCGGRWPWNRNTWARACNWYWLKQARRNRPEFSTRGMRRQKQVPKVQFYRAPSPRLAPVTISFKI